MIIIIFLNLAFFSVSQNRKIVASRTCKIMFAKEFVSLCCTIQIILLVNSLDK